MSKPLNEKNIRDIEAALTELQQRHPILKDAVISRKTPYNHSDYLEYNVQFVWFSKGESHISMKMIWVEEMRALVPLYGGSDGPIWMTLARFYTGNPWHRGWATGEKAINVRDTDENLVEFVQANPKAVGELECIIKLKYEDESSDR